MNFQGKTFLITGASKGIGRALALALAAQKANLGLVARSKEALQSLKKETEALGANTEIFVGSVADEYLVERVVNTLIREFDFIDYLINNAGYGIFGSTESIYPKDWSDLMDTNVKGTFLFCKAIIPYMKMRKKGHIINIASDVAKRVFEGGSLYCASKYAQDALSMTLRKEVRPSGIKVSVIYSGLVDTDFHEQSFNDDKVKYWLKTEDMVNAIFYVAGAPPHVVIDELMIHPLSQVY